MSDLLTAPDCTCGHRAGYHRRTRSGVRTACTVHQDGRHCDCRRYKAVAG